MKINSLLLAVFLLGCQTQPGINSKDEQPVEGPIQERLISESNIIRNQALKELKTFDKAAKVNLTEELKKQIESSDGNTRYYLLQALQSLLSKKITEKLTRNQLARDNYIIGYFKHTGSLNIGKITEAGSVPQNTYNATDNGFYTISIKGISLMSNVPFENSGPLFSSSTPCDQSNFSNSWIRGDPLEKLERYYFGSGKSSFLNNLGEEIPYLHKNENDIYPSTISISEKGWDRIHQCETLVAMGYPNSSGVLESIYKTPTAVKRDQERALNPHDILLVSQWFDEEDNLIVSVNKIDITKNQQNNFIQACGDNGKEFYYLYSPDSPAIKVACQSSKDNGTYVNLNLTNTDNVQLSDSPGLLSINPIEIETWSTRWADDRELKEIAIIANKHMGAWGKIDPESYDALEVLKGENNLELITVPLFSLESGPDSYLHLILIKKDGVWQEHYGTTTFSIDPFVDIDRDGFPEFVLREGKYRSLEKIAPNHRRIASITGS